jgi:hypothetical protein
MCIILQQAAGRSKGGRKEIKKEADEPCQNQNERKE